MAYPGTVVYDKELVLKQALHAIEAEEMTMISEVLTVIPISKPTLYLPEWVDVYNQIQKAVHENRTRIKSKYRKRWQQETAAPVLQLAGYKLIADEDELERLTVNNNNTKHSGEIKVQWEENRSYLNGLAAGAEDIQVEQQDQITNDSTDTVG